MHSTQFCSISNEKYLITVACLLRCRISNQFHSHAPTVHFSYSADSATFTVVSNASPRILRGNVPCVSWFCTCWTFTTSSVDFCIQLSKYKKHFKSFILTVTCREQEQTCLGSPLWKHSKQIILNIAILFSIFLTAAGLFGKQLTESTFTGQQATAELFNLSISHWFLITFRHKTVTIVYLCAISQFRLH